MNAAAGGLKPRLPHMDWRPHTSSENVKLFLRLPLGSPCRPLAGHDGFACLLGRGQRGEKDTPARKPSLPARRPARSVQDSFRKRE